MLMLRVLDVRVQQIQNGLERHIGEEHIRIMEENAALRERLIGKTTVHEDRLKNRIIVLRARNYALTRQLAESNAFLESKE